MKGSFARCTPDSLSPRNRGELMDLTWDGIARDKDESDEIDSIETTDVEMGEMERSLAAQEMICGGAMISKSKRCHSVVLHIT